MIYLISDLHGDENFKGFNEYLEKATKDDLLIILGDVGLNFDNSEKTKKFTEYFLSVKKNIAFNKGYHRYGADAEFLGEIGLLVNIYFAEFDSGIFLLKRLNNGRKHSARCTPGCKKIYYNQLLCTFHLFFKIFIGYGYHNIFSNMLFLYSITKSGGFT